MALTIGVHCGASYAAGTVFASAAMASQCPSVFQVATSLPGDVGGAARVLLYVVTYLVLVGWLLLYRGGGDVRIETGSPTGPNAVGDPWITDEVGGLAVVVNFVSAVHSSKIRVSV